MTGYFGVPQQPRYLVEREIGKGGFGVVSIATDTLTRTKVAIKFLKPNASQREVERFRREVEEVRKFNSARIVRILDFNLSCARPFYVMPLYSGSLRDRLAEYSAQNQKFTAQVSLEMLLPILDGLEVAHGRGVFHRDLKPENILLDAHGLPVICDFGIGKFAHRQSMMLTMGGELGTPDYCSPEQWESGEGSAAADIFSLGIMLYEMTVGWRPNRDGEQVHVPSVLDNRIPVEIDSLIGLMVAPIGQRLNTCAAVRAEIVSILERVFATRKPASSGVGLGAAAAAIVLGGLALWGLSKIR